MMSASDGNTYTLTLTRGQVAALLSYMSIAEAGVGAYDHGEWVSKGRGCEVAPRVHRGHPIRPDLGATNDGAAQLAPEDIILIEGPESV